MYAVSRCVPPKQRKVLQDLHKVLKRAEVQAHGKTLKQGSGQKEQNFNIQLLIEKEPNWYSTKGIGYVCNETAFGRLPYSC